MLLTRHSRAVVGAVNRHALRKNACALSVFTNERYYSTPLSSAGLTVERTQNPGKMLPLDQLVFGKTFSDHMLEVEWSKEKGWENPKIVPYHNLNLDPATVVFHYAVEIFEGMKAYKDADGQVRLFRPDKNMERMNNSAARMALPTFDSNEMQTLLKELVKVEKDWVPDQPGYSLYLRPTMISTQETLGVGESTKALFYCICSPVGPYYKTGFAPVKLYADRKHVRAWPGGVGFAKCGGNYAATIQPQLEAAKKGYSQVLWLFGDHEEVTEVGTMNFMMIWKNEQGGHELVTAPLDDGTILPGVTRDSVLSLAREWGTKVTERKFTMKEVLKALDDGRVQEMFGCGTACIISPIEEIFYNDKTYKVPCGDGVAGPMAMKLLDTIQDIQYGRMERPDWSIVCA
eukprot:Clim_evm37s225 gene=Clim_evmTU37s225